MKKLIKISNPLKAFEILSIDENKRTFKTEDDIKWLLETDSIYFSEKGRLIVDEYEEDYSYVGCNIASVGDYIVLKGHHEGGEPAVKLLKRRIADREYEVAE